MDGALFFAGVYVASCAALIGFFWCLCKASEKAPFVDPSTRAIREDREVESLDAIWEMPSFDPREMA